MRIKKHHHPVDVCVSVCCVQGQRERGLRGFLNNTAERGVCVCVCVVHYAISHRMMSMRKKEKKEAQAGLRNETV